MQRKMHFIGAALGALLLSTSPVLASSNEGRARAAIAAADAKIEAAGQVGAAGEAPRLTAEAQAALRTAREELARGHERKAFDAANHAAQLADTALGAAQRSRAESESAARTEAERSAAAAQEQAAAATARAEAAEQAARRSWSSRSRRRPR